MKDYLLALVIIGLYSMSYAFECSKQADKVINKLAAHNRTSVTINYSADKSDWAQTCKSTILAKNAQLNVNLNQVNGSDIFKFSK